MSYEVELKFRVADPQELGRRLQELGAVWSEPVRQQDTYFGHPTRSFAETDEALRIRQVGETAVLTYKGPVIDSATKTRQEIEVPVAEEPAAAAHLRSILTHLSFRTVRDVCKFRRTATVRWRDVVVTCGWDDVAPLGTFLELELVTDDAGIAAAQSIVLDLAHHLALISPEPRSYLELLLAYDAQTASTTPEHE